MKLLLRLTFGGLALGAVAATSLPSQAEVKVNLAPPDQQRLGIASAPLVERKEQASVTGLARVMDVGPLAALDAEIASARAGADASKAEAERRVRLAAADQSASRQAVEAARAQAAVDEARLRLAEQRLGLEWGSGIAHMSASQRAQLIGNIGDGDAVLLRIDAMDTTVIPPTAAGPVTLHIAPSGAMLTGISLGLAPTADPRLQTVGVLVLVQSRLAPGFRTGRIISVELETGPLETGVVLPGSSLIRLDGATWAYVRTGATEMTRRLVVGARPVRDGWFVTTGFKPGEDIVVTGAGSVLAVERGGNAAPEMD